MSRTFKDRPSKIRFPEAYPKGYTLEKTKKKKTVDTEWHWMSTPSWWTRLMMTRPERRANKVLERKALFSDLDSVDFPDLGRSPHTYFW